MFTWDLLLYGLAKTSGGEMAMRMTASIILGGYTMHGDRATLQCMGEKKMMTLVLRRQRLRRGDTI